MQWHASRLRLRLNKTRSDFGEEDDAIDERALDFRVEAREGELWPDDVESNDLDISTVYDILL